MERVSCLQSTNLRGEKMSLPFAASGNPMDAAAFDQSCSNLSISASTLWAVLSVETSGCGYLPDRRPLILFERHYFSRLTEGKYDAAHPGISNSQAGGYGKPGANQYARLAEAIALDRSAALRSASWGIGQIMGANYAACGCANVEEMVAKMVDSEGGQLACMAAFVAGKGLAAALKAGDWARFARGYNGPNYAINAYDQKLLSAHARFEAEGCPDIDVRAAQMRLTYRGFAPGAIDGLIGQKTIAALTAFQQQAGLPATGKLDGPTKAALAAP
jgi:hypothetical protein